MIQFPLKRITICTLLLFMSVLAACGGGSDEIMATATGGQVGPNDFVITAMPPAPHWVEAAAVITGENASNMSFLGRLDAPGAISTLFDYAFSPDGTRLAALNNDYLLLWDLINGQLIASNTRQGASHIFYSADKSEIYTLDTEGDTLVFDTEQVIRQADFLAHTDFSGVATYYDEDGWLAVGGRYGSVKVWDPIERVSLVTLEADDVEITRLAFSDDGQLLATMNKDGIVRVWNWREREIISVMGREDETIGLMAFSPDGQELAVAANAYIAVWDVSDGSLVYYLQSGRGAASNVLVYSPDGRYILSGGFAPGMILWDAESGELLFLLEGVGGERVSAAFSPDGTLLLASALDGPVTMWGMAGSTGETLTRANLSVGTERVLFVDWSPDGYLMTFFDASAPVYVWGIAAETE